MPRFRRSTACGILARLQGNRDASATGEQPGRVFELQPLMVRLFECVSNVDCAPDENVACYDVRTSPNSRRSVPKRHSNEPAVYH